jgi:hypothetical protein
VERPWTFQTRQLGDPEHFVRTFGVLLDVSSRARAFAAREVSACAEPAPPPNCAHGKVVVVSQGESAARVACYQRAQGGAQPAVVACCNGAAAAAAHHAGVTGRSEVSLRLRVSNRYLLRARARIDRDAHGVAVTQTWQRVSFTPVREERVDGRDCALFTGALNHYLVVRARAGESTDAVSPAEAQSLAKHFGLDEQPLLARVAVLARAPGELPRLKVYTCGRAHPSAPPTGLAALALAAERVDWLPLRAGASVQTPAGPMQLPTAARRLPDGTADLEFAPLRVQLARANADSLPVAG